MIHAMVYIFQYEEHFPWQSVDRSSLILAQIERRVCMLQDAVRCIGEEWISCEVLRLPHEVDCHWAEDWDTPHDVAGTALLELTMTVSSHCHGFL
jgi:hypothetical protein